MPEPYTPRYLSTPGAVLGEREPDCPMVCPVTMKWRGECDCPRRIAAYYRITEAIFCRISEAINPDLPVSPEVERVTAFVLDTSRLDPCHWSGGSGEVGPGVDCANCFGTGKAAAR